MTHLYTCIIVDIDILTSVNPPTHDPGKRKQCSDIWVDFGRKSVRRPKVKLHTNWPSIENVDTHIHVGIKFQQHGSWRTHIHSKACTCLTILRMLKHILKRGDLIKS